jgi:hypothetical protein
MSNPTIDDLYKRITFWFHESGAIHSVHQLYGHFLHYVNRKKLHLNLSQVQLWKSLCGVTCSLRLAYLRKSSGSLARNHSSSRPQGWKEEYEEYWELILEDLFSEDILTSFFDSIPEEVWEYDVKNWREVIGCFLPDYIYPTFELLEKFGYIVKENDEWIPYEEIDWND